MLQTNDYSLFQFADYNRKINKNKVLKIANDIKINGQINPVIIDKENVIIDGQHRVKACISLDIPILYDYTEKKATPNLVKSINQSQSNWLFNDFYEVEIYKQNVNYIIYKEFREKYELKHDIALRLLNIGSYNKKTGADFKDGKFEVKTFEKAELIITYIKQMQSYTKYAKSREFISAVIILANDKQFNLNMLVDKVRQYNDRLRDCTSTESYLKNIVLDVYNYKNRKSYILNIK